MVIAGVVFLILCVMAYSVVNNLYLRMEIKDLKEKLSTYTTPIAPVSLVYGDTEVAYIDEEV